MFPISIITSRVCLFFFLAMCMVMGVAQGANVIRDIVGMTAAQYDSMFQHSHLPYGIVNGFFCDDVLVASEGDAHACKDRVFSYVLEQRRKGNFCPWPPPKPWGLASGDTGNVRIMEVSVLKTGTTDRRDKLNMHCWRSDLAPVWNRGDVLDRLSPQRLRLFMPAHPEVQQMAREALEAKDRRSQYRACFVEGSVCHCRNGHNDFSDYWFLPRTNTNFYTFVREATARYLSFYEYYKMQHSAYLQALGTATPRFAFFETAVFHTQNLTTLERYMDFYTEEQSYLFEYAYNVQVFMFSGIMLHSNVVPNEARRPDDIAKLRKDAEINICNMFQFVGIFENVPDSIILYKKVFGEDAVRDYDGRGKHANVNTAKLGKPKAEDRYPAALLTRLRAAQVEEIALYAMAKKRFEAHFRLVTGEQSATAQ